ncbi:hypothetical protein DFQ27_001354 [Actinomortierella ambigua]|uniref:DH domain-containing protein n=1 Tax=Actinomortierella ambigua TaxID=1343610 RepID=A0A9P6QCH2_9FUNG|nr:hypothetical protein DFQ27_001354 [Actinomortierella ambigua]
MKFMNVQVPESLLSTPEFARLVSMYSKQQIIQGVLHHAFKEYLSSIPDLDLILKQEIAQSRDHSVFILSDLGWTGSDGHVMSLVDCLAEIKHESFPGILRNLEAQMRPSAMTIDIVFPDSSGHPEDKKTRFWEFFKTLGDRVELEPFSLIQPRTERFSAFKTYEKVYLCEARYFEGSNRPLDKYEIRVVFNNIEQIVAANTAFLRDLDTYRSEVRPQRDLGDICKQHMKLMACYRRYLLGYSKSTQMVARLLKKNVNFQKFLDRKREMAHDLALSDLLVEPTQRIARYPLLFKEILAGTPAGSHERKGLLRAIELASEISEMDNGKPEQNAALQFRIRNTVDGCPDTLIRADRAVHAFLDGHEANMLTGEKGKPLTMVLFSDKVMLLRRPKSSRGEQLFAASGLSSGRITEKRETILSSKWKFLGWMDVTKLEIVCVEQTDPEGLFCIITRDAVDSKEEPWEAIRGFLPEDLDKRDPFISKFNAALSLSKAHKGDPSYTCRLHVADLELFFNAYSESIYRDIKHKVACWNIMGQMSLLGQMTLFYQDEHGIKPEVIQAIKLPPFVGVIEDTGSSYSVMLRGKISMEGCTGSLANSKVPSSFTDLEAFQICLTELASPTAL